MWRYVLRRLTGAVVVLFLTTLFVAYAVRLSGDPTVAMFQGGSAPTPDQLAQMRAALGIDRPFWQQYTDFASERCRVTWAHPSGQGSRSGR